MSSPASPSAATPSPSIIPSTGPQSTLSLDELHRYVREQACNRAEPVVDTLSTIGPHLLPPSSIFIGQRRLKGGRDDDTTVRLMFRCVWPPKSVSRHVIIHMKPSVPEEALALKLCQVFEIPASGGVITKTLPEFIPGHQPIPTPGRSKNLWHVLPEMASRIDRVLEDIFVEMFEALGSTMAGFTEVTVVSLEQMGVCAGCGRRMTIGAEILQTLRKYCFGVNMRCGRYYQMEGVDKNVVEMCMGGEDGQVLPRIS